MNKIESFEVTEYGEKHEIPGKVQGAIKEIVLELKRENPSVGVQVSFVNDMMRLSYHSYEAGLSNHLKIRDVEDASKKYLNETLKTIKSEFRKKMGKTLTVSEKKEMAGTSVQKVSLNERYMFSSWRFYEIG